MKIHSVTMEGFGPYRDRQVVDLDAFDDDGIYLIAGRTGAGKSSILDAITFGLYGRVPRYEGKVDEQVRSDHIAPDAPCVVEVEFTAGDSRYRVERTPSYRRPKLKGTGFTTQSATCTLSRLDDGQWAVIETRLGNAETHVSEVVRLTAQQFQQVILLAQGQFQEFLVASSDKRRDLLRSLFDTRRFADYSEILDARAKVLREELASSAASLGSTCESLERVSGQPIPDGVDPATGSGVAAWAADLVAQQQALVDAAALQAGVAREAFDDATTQQLAATDLAGRQRRLREALERQVGLEVEAPQIESDRARVSAGTRADRAASAVDRDERAATQLAKTSAQHRSAAEALTAEMPQQAQDADSLQEAAARLGEQRGALRAAADQEAALPALEASVEAATAALQDFDQTARAETTRRTELQEQLAQVVQQQAELAEAPDELAAASHELTTQQAALAAARRGDTLRRQLDEAVEARDAGGRAVTAASRAQDDLRAAHRAGLASALAVQLVDDEPCAVCGSTTHPAPATPDGELVDDSHLEQAADAFAQAVTEAQRLEQVVTRLTTQAEAEFAAAGERDTAELIGIVAEAEQARDLARKNRDELTALATRHQNLSAGLEQVAALIESAHQRRADLAAAEVSATERLRAALTAVEAARAEHPTVAHRVEVVERHLRLTEALLRAHRALGDAAHEADEAGAVCASALAEHGFDDVAAVRAARLPTDLCETLTQRVKDHDASQQVVAETLAAPELQDLPAEPVDLEAPTEAQRSARAAHDDAVGVESAARQKLHTLTGLRDAVTSTLAGAAAAREHYEVVERLALTVRGRGPNTKQMMLETFALAAELEDIVAAANTRLTVMTSGRYEFLHSDKVGKGQGQFGLSLEVLDSHTGDTRPPQSLSGGEKFQASLALALGLAEVVTGRAGGLRLDTLFIDEGFGSLDPETLETTMATLDGLREGGRTIGLISHVEAMKETIPAQLHVDVADGGWSTIRQN